VNFISESKKSDVAQKLKQKYEYDGSVIDRILESDPTGSKYVEYLGRMFDQFVSGINDGKGGLSVPIADFIENKLRIWVEWFHRNYNKITSEDVRNALSDFRNTKNLIDVDKLIKSPKDINNYADYNFFDLIIEQVDSKKTKSEKEEEAKKEAEKIYEDDEVLIIKPLSHSSSCYYGYGTKWCTTTKESDDNFRKYTKRGDLYYFINKKENFKYALFKPKDGKAEIYNSADSQEDISVLYDEFPKQIDIIMKLAKVTYFPKAVKLWVKGEISTDELLDIEPMLMSPGMGIKGKSDAQLTFEFENDEVLLNLLDLSEDDIWFLKTVENNYSSYDFIDPYSTEEDWKEGYGPVSNINGDNLKKLSDICFILTGKKYDLNNPDTEFLKMLLKTFEREINDIINEYHWRLENEMRVTAKEEIEKEIDTFLESIGFKLIRDFDRISTTPGNLVMYSLRYKIDKGDIKDIFKVIAEKNKVDRLGGWYENQYEFRNNDNFDDSGYQREVERNLDRILEKIGENPNYEEVSKKLTKLFDKYELDIAHKFPSNKKYNFRIRKYDFDEDKLIIELGGPLGMKRIKISLDGFIKILYQPTLFDLSQIFQED